MEKIVNIWVFLFLFSFSFYKDNLIQIHKKKNKKKKIRGSQNNYDLIIV